MLKEYKICENYDKFLIHGRSLEKDGRLGFIWAASGLEFNFTGIGADFTFGCLSGGACYLKVTLDGKSQKHCLTTGNEHIIIDGLEDAPHSINIIRITTETASELYFDTVTIEGESPEITDPPKEKELKIEFYGDSITCGYGNLGYDGPGYLAHRSDGTKTYAYLTCEVLGAEGRFNGFSGQGIVHAWGGARGVPFGEFYCRALRTLEEKWDFSKWTPNVVVINGGTNDSSTGVDREEFITEAKSLMSNLRREYPKALIIWLYGMMGRPLEEHIKTAIGELSKNDKAIRYLATEPHYSSPEEKGGNGHPGVKCHERVSRELAEFIKAELGL